ncbi:chemotaxis protein CheW [Inconstantimicrobium mannanitabidum]|uniref:chemotaxis protein CheW n=1 Tax=Inconstantimicrobium mannanitabidum TaxID=1604901 RepID=UPI0021C36166|nr:chemotaxis protein CheW [Clostridium sp. TW13]
MQVVVFNLGNEQFAVETSKIQTITDVMKVTRVPKAPAHIRGLINLRGSILSLLDINLLLGLDNSESNKTEAENIIILKVNDEQIGISVDQVHEVLDVEEKSIQKFNDDKNQAYIKGILNFSDRVVTVIDIDKLLTN